MFENLGDWWAVPGDEYAGMQERSRPLVLAERAVLGFRESEPVWLVEVRRGETGAHMEWLVDFDYATEIPQIQKFYRDYVKDFSVNGGNAEAEQ